MFTKNRSFCENSKKNIYFFFMGGGSGWGGQGGCLFVCLCLMTHQP